MLRDLELVKSSRTLSTPDVHATFLLPCELLLGLLRECGSDAGAVIFQIQITKTYNTTNLLEDIKGLYKTAGLKGQKIAFIFT